MHHATIVQSHLYNVHHPTKGTDPDEHQDECSVHARKNGCADDTWISEKTWIQVTDPKLVDEGTKTTEVFTSQARDELLVMGIIDAPRIIPYNDTTQIRFTCTEFLSIEGSHDPPKEIYAVSKAPQIEKAILVC